MQLETGTRRLGRRLGFGLLLLFVSLRALAQISGGPISTQSLFLNQAGSVHGNYLEAEAGLLYSDNVYLTPSGGGDGLAMIGLVGNTERVDAPRFDYHLDSDLALVKYFKNEFQTQPFGYLDGYGDFKIVPGTFSWTARDTFTQTSLDPAAPPSPDNLESINYLTTGPQLILKPTLRTTITIDGTVSYVYSDSKSPEYVDIDSHRYGGDLRIDRAFSNMFSAYISGTYQDVKFKDTVENTDFAFEQGVVGFKLGTARTVLDANIGYTLAHVDAAQQFTIPRLHLDPYPSIAAVTEAATAPPTSNPGAPSGVTWQINLSRLISPTQRVTLRTMREVTDVANLFLLNLAQPVPGSTQNQLTTGQPFTHQEYGATWRYDNTRTSLELDALAYKNTYSATPGSNQDSKVINAIAGRKLNQSFTAEFALSYEHDQYPLSGSLHTVNVLASVRWRVGPKIGLRFIYAHSALSPNGYSENQIGVIASYALTRAAEAQDSALKPIEATSQPLF